MPYVWFQLLQCLVSRVLRPASIWFKTLLWSPSTSDTHSVSATHCIHLLGPIYISGQAQTLPPLPGGPAFVCVENPFPLLLSQNENATKDSTQCSTTWRSSHNYPSDSKAHSLPELSRMMDLRHTNSSPWRFIMRNRAAVARSMSKISTMPSTHFPWFLCEYQQCRDIHSLNLVVPWVFHPLGPIPSNLISSAHEQACDFLLCAHLIYVWLQKHCSQYPM